MASTKRSKICQVCSVKKPMAKFYNSNSKFCPDGKMNICKDCLKNMIDVNDDNTVISVLRQIDKPWVPEVWQKAKESNNNPLGEYIKMMNSLPQYRDLTWEDTDTNVKSSQPATTPVVVGTIPELNFTVTPEMIKRWGTGYTPEEYMYLENMWEEMHNSYQIETASHKDYTKKICKISLQIDKADRANDTKLLTQLIQAYDKLMHSAKFTAVQRTAADRTGGLNSFGEWFALAEKEGFIPRYHTDEPQDIVDLTMEEYKKYVRELVLGDPSIAQMVEEHLKKMLEKGDIEDEVDEVLDDEDVSDLDDSEWDGVLIEDEDEEDDY
jgi:hypothetical protein